MNAIKIPSNYYPDLNTKEQLSSLRKDGWQVQIRHWRYMSCRNGNPILIKKSNIRDLYRIGKASNEQFIVSPCGGETRVDIRRGEEHFFAYSVCSKKDIFCYKTGAAYALYRISQQVFS